MRRGPELIVALLSLLGIAVLLWLAAIWTFMGVPPHQYVTLLIYRTIFDDVPRFEIPLQLATSEPVVFPARIIEKRRYWLNLRVYFDGAEQRLAVARALGDRTSVNSPGEATMFRVEVRDKDNLIVHESGLRSEGRFDAAENSLGRRIDEFVLTRGIYNISVTPLSGSSALTKFRAALELTYQPNSTPIP